MKRINKPKLNDRIIKFFIDRMYESKEAMDIVKEEAKIRNCTVEDLFNKYKDWVV